MERWVNFVVEGKQVALREGATILDAQIAAGLPADAPCGGRGDCQKCLVDFRQAGEAAWRRALACQTRVEADLEVRTLHREARLRAMTEGQSAAAARWNPLVQIVHVRVAPCGRGEAKSDWERLCDALDGALGARNWRFDPAACEGLSRLLAKAAGEVWVVACEERVLELSEAEPEAYMAAFDLGTTTVAGYLIHVNARAQAASAGALNPQTRYGGDVIARIDRALSEGAEALADCARSAVNELIRGMCAQVGAAPERVFAVMLAGNTAMHHLFLNLSPDALARAPYNPAVRGALNLPAREQGLCAHPSARLLMLPVIGGFVGADTVACLISGDWLHRDALTLMIDIGTNGELVLGGRERRIACSTAAGPALEGAKISCGMRGARGAIDRVWLEDGALRWHVIGDCAPEGICGSGLVDLVAALLASGELDASGRLRSGEKYALAGTRVHLTQRDVREIQLAKAAIAAGIQLLAARLGVEIEDIQEVDLAGAFGSRIDPASACAIGLFPEELRGRIVPVGNAAGEGAKLALTDAENWRQAEALARGCAFLELAALPEFQDVFVDMLAFPGEEDE